MKLSQDLLKKIVTQYKEPQWLQSQRESAWVRFEKAPYPTVKDEEWKYTSLKDFNLSDYNVVIKEPTSLQALESLPSEFQSLVAGHDGALVQQNGVTLYRTLGQELVSQSVILCDLKTAIQEHAALIDPILKDIEKTSLSKFASLHQALWHGGMFLYVPKGVEIKAPIYNLVSLASPNATIFPYSIIVVEPGAQVSVIDEWISPDVDVKQFSNGFHYLHVKEGARLDYVHIQRWGNRVDHFDAQLARVERDGNLNSVLVGLGGRRSKSHVHTILEGPGAEATPLGVFFGTKDQHFDTYTIQDHVSCDTRSDLLFKSALKDHAQSSYQGIIRVPKQAQRTDAYQANRNLLLDKGAKARSSPKLEIIADDVRCTHGATVGTVDEDELFYLESRGLSREEATQMIVQGFFEQVFQRIPSEDIRKRLHEVVKSKLEGELRHE